MTFEALSTLPPEVALSRTRLARQGPKHIVLRTLETGVTTFVGPRHPAVLSLIELDTLEGSPVALYDYVAGVTLRELVAAFRQQARPAPLDLLGRVIIDAAMALGAVTGVHWHNGISDGSILVGFDGVTRVLDYGAPRNSGRFGSRSALPGAQRDVFTLGAVIHSVLTGFAGHYATTALLDTPSKGHGDVSPALDDVVLTAMSPALDQRQASVAQLANELEGALGGSVLDTAGVSATLKRLFRDRISALIKATATPPAEKPSVPYSRSVADEAEPSTQIAPPFVARSTGMLPKELAPPSIAPSVASPTPAPAVKPSGTPAKPGAAYRPVATPRPKPPVSDSKPALGLIAPAIVPLKPPGPLEITTIATSPQGASIPMSTVIIGPKVIIDTEEEKTNIGALPPRGAHNEFDAEERTMVGAPAAAVDLSPITNNDGNLDLSPITLDGPSPETVFSPSEQESTGVGIVPVSLRPTIDAAQPQSLTPPRDEETRPDRPADAPRPSAPPQASPPSPPFDLFAAPPPVRAPRALGEETGESLISGSVLTGESLLLREPEEPEEPEQTESVDPLTGEVEVSQPRRARTLVPQALFIIVALLAIFALSLLIFIRTRSQIVRVPMTPVTVLVDAGDRGLEPVLPGVMDAFNPSLDAGTDDDEYEDDEEDAGPPVYERNKIDGGVHAVPRPMGAAKHKKKRRAH